MARKGREISRTGMYHVILRGIGKLFFSNADYDEFLNLLVRYFDGDNADLYAYSLENNKIHLVFKVTNSTCDVLKPMCTSYARYINRTHNKKGRLFYDRFMSKPIDSYDELSEVIGFVSNKQSISNSLAEYEEKPLVCAVEKIRKNIDISKIINPDIIIPYTDDYASMTDNQLKKIVMFCFRKKSSAIKKDELKEIIDLSVKKSNISKSRLYRIFGMSPKYEKSKVQEEKKPQAPAAKKELSVWLL